MKRKITRAITAPMIYTKSIPTGFHLPGATLRSAEAMAKTMAEGEVIKVVVETRVYELDEETFLEYAKIIEPKEKGKSDKEDK